MEKEWMKEKVVVYVIEGQKVCRKLMLVKVEEVKKMRYWSWKEKMV